MTVLAKQPEGKLSLRIMKAWRDRGAYCYKVWGNEMTPVGTPDISGVVKGWSIWCESKMPGNKPSMAQWKRIRDLRRAGALVVVAYSVKDAVQMIDHVLSNDHTFDECDCLYVEEIDLVKKRQDGDYSK